MPAHGLLVVEVDTDTVSMGSRGTQKVVCQERVVIHGCQGCQDLWELQGVLGSETVEVLQTGCLVGRDHWEAWVHDKRIHPYPMVGVIEVVEV